MIKVIVAAAVSAAIGIAAAFLVLFLIVQSASAARANEPPSFTITVAQTPRNLPDNQEVYIRVRFCEENRNQQQWISSTEPEIAIAFIRLVFGYLNPLAFKQIVVALRPDLRQMADDVVAACFTPPGQPL